VRDVERLLIGLNVAGSLIQGWRHELTWLPVPAVAFLVYVVIEDRALRRRIGPRAWPSEGYARFNFNTNLYFSLKQILLGSALFVAAGYASGLLHL
jgi:hypothetical protein